MAEYRLIAVGEIAEPPAPVRAEMDEHALLDLAESIKQIGIVQPLIVVPAAANGEAAGAPPNGADTLHPAAEPKPDGADSLAPSNGSPASVPNPAVRYEVVAGHRRLLAARHIQLREVPCMVYDKREVAEHAVMLHENIYREDLTAAEEGIFYAELIERYDCTEEALCAMVRQKPDYIYARLSLVSGDSEVLDAVAKRRISFAVAKELNKCPDESARRYWLGLAVQGGATASTVRNWVARLPLDSQPAEPIVDPPADGSHLVDAQASAMRCELCGRGDHPENLKIIYVCYYEWESVKTILQRAGVDFATERGGA